ncbi:hypothetical protein [Actinokineospora xionganensis]|uniref:DUF3618 domain-containing protein n=1 Tax=Actinokineospora xionganensis TaxID=2684470 RepID=A0ABR7LFQ3_9PSEU|nr:hypothetical protein [Actinokineospora xionganensis]MBC6451558.1 hypothetical protein [Actinokineospora xionganensis]
MTDAGYVDTLLKSSRSRVEELEEKAKRERADIDRRVAVTALAASTRGRSPAGTGHDLVQCIAAGEGVFLVGRRLIALLCAVALTLVNGARISASR